ncbi:MAG: class I SAM-dependent methyltransferase [Thermodesulfobacteriota bacterium]
MFKGYDNRSYVANYRDLYVNNHFWAPKYRCNETIIRCLQKGNGQRVWLDLCCGQGQYFCIPDLQDDIKYVGIDASMEQLAIAYKSLQNRADFIVADVRDQNLPLMLGKAHLVTLMWGAYCYLGSLDEIRLMIENVARILPQGGAFYLEVIEPTTLKNFNSTNFAQQTGASVRVNDWHGGGLHWTYEDHGGEHRLFSPTLDWVLTSMSEAGLLSDCVTTVQTLHQVVGFKQS